MNRITRFPVVRVGALALVASVFALASAFAEEAPPEPALRETVEVRSRADDPVGVADSAAEGVTGRDDLARRPLLRAGEVIETVPGVIATQHSGGGKANQYFLRGFNLDHGTDLRITVDGMQVNMPTHGHGQGYSDLNFLIPEVIDTVRFHKGTFTADQGDFSAAGAIDIDYVSSLDRPLVSISAGEDSWQRAVLAASTGVSAGTLLGAIEYQHYDGPWERPDDFRRVNGLVRYSWDAGQDRFGITAMGYDGHWDATDQIPRRAVESGLIGRFGLLDADLGGESHRYSVSGSWQRAKDRRLTEARLYLIDYQLDLLSNFTYFLDDPDNGDEFLQQDDRLAWGGRLERRHESTWGSRAVTWGYGAEFRQDRIDNGLFRTASQAIVRTVREDDVDQRMLGGWIDASVRFAPAVRATFGLRADGYDVDVDSNLSVNSGSESDALVSPKLSLVFGPWSKTEIYVDAGYGFHSNDARGATIRVDPTTGDPQERVDPLVRAFGADVGVRTSALPGLVSSATAFLLELDSELVFVGDAGGTEASRPSRRVGIELANFYRPAPWLSFDVDIALTRAEFTDDDPAGDEIPGAIEEAVAAGVAFDGMRGVFGAVRWRYFGGRPLIEDESVRSGSTSLVNARVGYAFRNGLRVAIDVFNVLDREDSDIEYFYASRLAGEPEEGVEDVHFHPMESRTVRLTMNWSL